MTSLDDILDRVLEVLRDETEKQDIADDTSLIGSSLVDSIALVRLASVIEDEAGITIPDGELSAENFDTLGQIRSYLQSRMP